jgi:uncharacterized membrane protein
MFEAIVGLLVLGAFISSQSAIKAARNAETEIRFLRRRLEVTETELAALRTRTIPAAPVEASAAPPEPAGAPEPGPEPAVTLSEPPSRPFGEPDSLPQPLPLPEPPPQRQAAAMSAAPEPARVRGLALEKHFTENWLVWLGGITLALGGAFLVKYSLDQGWIGPAVRVSLGVLFGLALIAGGHVLGGRSEPVEMAGLDPSYVPPALVGAGSAIVFVSIYAAFALFDLLGPMPAFIALAATSAATVLLALRHGPYVALLGLVGANAVPLLVQTGHRNAWLLFAYLLLLDAGALMLVRWKAWWRLGWAVLGAAGLWGLIWLVEPFTAGDEIPLGIFLLALFGLGIALRRGIPRFAWLTDPVTAPGFGRLVVATGVGVAVLLYMLVVISEQSTAALAVMLAYGMVVMAAARFDAAYDRLPVAGGLLGLLCLAGWDLPGRMVSFDLIRHFVPDHAQSFTVTAGLLGLLFGGGGFAALWGTPRPGRWAALSAAMSVALFAESYWRFSSLGGSLAWAAGALCLAGLLLVAAERVSRWRSVPGMEEALAAYAIGVLAAMALAFTIAMEDAWLTVALALMLPGIAWVNSRLRVARLRHAAVIVAVIVLARLAFNPYVLGYPIGDGLVFNWLLYGYGLPMLSFAAAAWLFRRDADDLLVQVLEGGAAVFLVLLTSLEIRHANVGALAAHTYDLPEQSLHSLAWLSIATVFRRLGGSRPVLKWASRVLIGLATAQILLLQLLVSNPLLSYESAGERAVFNILLLAYGLPAALYALLSFSRGESARLRQVWGWMALLLALVWISLEVRRAFHGAWINDGPVGSAELYSYSAVWLAYAGALLGAGLRWRSDALRHAGLGILVLVVLKVFLVDMSHLTGLWRALSFMGLGGALIGVGYLYRRFVRVQKGPAGQTAGPPATL